MPRVSIVMPVYNGEKYLRESIESVINQTYTDWELIIVDDGSTDSSPDIMKEYQKKDRRIIVHKNTENSKVSKSMNNGFAIAKGEFYTWTSDDNIYMENAIEELVTFLDDNPSVNFVYADSMAIDENGNELGIITDKPNLLYFDCVVGACFLYRGKAAKQVGEYNVNLNHVLDYEYWIRFDKMYGMSYLNKTLYYYRDHPGTLTNRKYKTLSKELYDMRYKYLDYLLEKADEEVKEMLYIDLLAQRIDKKDEVKNLFYGDKLPESLAWTENMEELDLKRGIIIFGCGKYGREAIEMIGHNNVAFFVDNDPQKHGDICEGKKIYSFDEMVNKRMNEQILIAVNAMFIPSIVKQLNDSNISGFASYINLKKDIK